LLSQKDHLILSSEIKLAISNTDFS
jgi:hypothetical protein